MTFPGFPGMGHYILDDKHQPVPVDTNTREGLIRWAKWFENFDNRRVAGDWFCGGVHVSTIFLAMDHGFSEGKPVLFETMIFRGRFDQEQFRYFTWEEAASAHVSIAERVLFVEGRRGYSRSHWRKIRRAVVRNINTLRHAHEYLDLSVPV